MTHRLRGRSVLADHVNAVHDPGKTVPSWIPGEPPCSGLDVLEHLNLEPPGTNQLIELIVESSDYLLLLVGRC